MADLRHVQAVGWAAGISEAYVTFM